MDWMTDSPITAIFGAHPHVDSGGSEWWRAGDGLVCRSLGNFLFDQTNGSGAPAELRFFDDKTFADAPAAYRPDFLGHLIVNIAGLHDRLSLIAPGPTPGPDGIEFRACDCLGS